MWPIITHVIALVAGVLLTLWVIRLLDVIGEALDAQDWEPWA